MPKLELQRVSENKINLALSTALLRSHVMFSHIVFKAFTISIIVYETVYIKLFQLDKLANYFKRKQLIFLRIFFRLVLILHTGKTFPTLETRDPLNICEPSFF